MPAKLTITRDSKADWVQEREFGQDEITIGRDNNNDVHLDDTKKVVSRKHAKIFFENEQYHLVDAGSHNFTFLNNEKVARNIPYALNDGDRIKIAEFTIHFEALEEDEHRDATVVLVNPFYEEMKIFAGLFRKMLRTYDGADPSTRKENLKFALQEILLDMDPGEMGDVFAAELGTVPAAPSPKDPEPETPKPKPKPEPEPVAKPAEKEDPSLLFSMSPDSAVTMQIGRALDDFMGQMIRLAGDAQTFSRDYLGHTMTPLPDQIADMSLDQLKDYLFDPDISPDAAQKRFDNVHAQLEEVAEQHASLVNLYRVSINDGAREMLNALDPAVVREELKQEGFRFGPLKIPYSLVPFFMKSKMSDNLENKINELMSNEKAMSSETFQPFFENAFLKKKKTGKKRDKNKASDQDAD